MNILIFSFSPSLFLNFSDLKITRGVIVEHEKERKTQHQTHFPLLKNDDDDDVHLPQSLEAYRPGVY